jgi:ABC-type transport system involved in multi-copper enzyme maturation permease subunit
VTAGMVMTTLRLHRAQIVITAALLALLAVAAVLDGLATMSFISDYRASNCPSPSCDALPGLVEQRYLLFGQLLPFIGLLPAAIGAFWGAPLLGREFENGTTHFAWTQSVSRRSWIRTRLAILGSLIAVGALVLGVAIDYWLSAFTGFDVPGALQSDFSFSHMRGTAAVGWWLLAFTLGAASGALLRRTVPAMVVTVVVTVAAVFARNLWFGFAIEGLTVSDALRLQHIETLTLIGLAVMLAVATSWSVEHAHA